MTRTTTALLAVIALAAVAMATVFILKETGHLGGKPEESEAHRLARIHAHDGAEMYCTLGGVVPGMTGLVDPAYLNCVKRETQDRMRVWENTAGNK